jgi:activator of HSP90 ATPase
VPEKQVLKCLDRDRRSFVGAAAAGIGIAALGVSAARAGATDTPRNIHQENEFAASPERIYGIFMDSRKFGVMTGLPAEIGTDAGSAFSMFGGIIIGRNIELVPAVRIVQAWKPNYWPPGVYSLVKFELVADGAKTKIMLDHTGFPDGTYDGLNSGWPKRYWDPLEKYLAANPSD